MDNSINIQNSVILSIPKKLVYFFGVIFLLGGGKIFNDQVIPYFLNEGPLPNWKTFFIFPGYIIFLTCISTYRLILIPEGHFAIFSIYWNNQTIFTFRKTPIRLWKDCLIELDIGWPFYAINIRESQFNYPAIMKFFVTNYNDACLFLLKYGNSERTDEITKKYLNKLMDINNLNQKKL